MGELGLIANNFNDEIKKKIYSFFRNWEHGEKILDAVKREMYSEYESNKFSKIRNVEHIR